MSFELKKNHGFTIIELLITTFIIGTVVTGLFGLFVLNLRSALGSELRIAAIALANERMEMVRNLPYEDVGTSGGVPAGAILQDEDIVRNGVTYNVLTDIRYIDDPYDGILGQGEEGKVTICHQPPGNPGGSQTLVVSDQALQAHLNHGDVEGSCPGDDDPNLDDPVNTDYKQARISVTWPSQYAAAPVLLITKIVPQGVEGGADEGTLDFTALDAAGVAVAGASVQVVNSQTTPTIDITTLTNNDGRVVLPGLPESSASYELIVAKDGYTSEQTYDPTESFFPSPEYSHLTMVAREVTEKVLFIDQAATLNIDTQDDGSPAKKVKDLAYRLVGTKQIGLDDNSLPVYKTDLQDQTGPNGSNQHNDLEWDSYDLIVDGLATGYDIKESSLVLPVSLDPAGTLDITLTLVPHTDISLRVNVVDPNGIPIDNANVQLALGGYDETLGTGVLGQVFFADIPIEADHTLTVDAAGFTTAVQTVSIAGNYVETVTLTSSP